MTPPIPPTPPRASVGMTIVNIADNVVVKIIGLIWFTGSGYFEYLEVTTDKVTSHMVLFAVSAVFGVLLAFTRPVVAATGSMLAVVGPYIPKLGFKRNDP